MKGIEIDRVLGDFRAWLEKIPTPISTTPSSLEEPVDLATLVRQFTALRQEVNLQTRASRNQLEQNAQVLTQLGETVEQLREQTPEPIAEETNTAEILRPLVKALIDARDALALAERHVAKMGAVLADPPTPPIPTPVTRNGNRREPVKGVPPAVVLDLPRWARWLGIEARVQAAVQPLELWAKRQTQTAAVFTEPEVPAPDNTAWIEWLARQREHNDQSRGLIESLLVGYGMSAQRLERALQAHGVQQIPCVGLSFDPEVMEVVEVVKQEGRTGTEVLEEVRPGYHWNGTLFRCSQVRVARS